MKVKIQITFAWVLLVCLQSMGQSILTNFKKGSLIIPMDNSKQNLISSQIAFNVKSYGLVNLLLQNNIPVNWIIKDAKAKDGIDFLVLSGRLYPTTTAAALTDYKSGPFVIDSLWASRAMPIIAAFGNNVAVYRAEVGFTAPVRNEIKFKPKIAVFTNGNSHAIHTKALRIAEFSSPRDFDSLPAQNFNSTSCYTFGCEPHWTNGQSAVTMQVTSFLNSGGNFFTQCAGIHAYEQLEHYHTTNGIMYETNSNLQDNNNLYFGTDQPLMQFEGNLTNEPTGTIINYKNDGGAYQPLTKFLVKKNPLPASGVMDGDVVVSTRKIGIVSAGGNVTYLGGHDYLKGTSDLTDYGVLGLDYARASDLSWNNGLRIFYNAIFMPSTRPTSCEFVFEGEAKVTTSVSDLAPCKEDTISYTISFTNLGPGTAHDVLVQTPINQSWLTYLSGTTPQGTYSPVTGQWDIGNVEMSQIVQLTINYRVTSDGTYNLQSYSANLIAGNSFAQDTSSLIITTNQNNPVLNVPNNVSANTNSGCTATGLNIGTPTVSDDCGIASVINDAPASFPLGPTVVTWTVTDMSGNIISAPQTVTVTDTENPTITTPADISLSTNSGCTASGLNLGTPITSDNCGVASVTNDAPASFPIGITTISWTVTDDSGNSVTATQTVTVSDTQNPVITVPNDVTATTNSGCVAAGLSLGTPSTSDNCGAASVTNDAPASFPIGITTVSWTVTDNSGNSVTAAQTVTVSDIENPTITTPANISASTNSGCVAVGLNLGSPSTSDNCGVASVTNDAPASFPLGTTTVTWMVTDNSGNTSSSLQMVTVGDLEAPVLSNCNDTIRSCESVISFQLPEAVDNCTLLGLNQVDGTGLNSGSEFADGYTILQYEASDLAGNQVTCTKVIYKIKIPELPDAGKDQQVYGHETTLNAASNPFGIGEWNILSGTAVIGDKNDPKSDLTGLESSHTILTWTLSNEGCESGTDTVGITYLDLNIPNAFSPDDDNTNDYFEIKGIESFAPARILITNRWGEVVYESNNYTNEWNGKNANGQELTNDTYFYQLVLPDGSEFSGFIILKRK